MSTAIDWDAIESAAVAVRERAYAPYSGYQVGAAILGEDGTIYRGANVENASYGLALCAERSAIAQAVAHGCTRFHALVVVTSSKSPAAPCGMCRQVLAEFAPNFPVRCVSTHGGRLDTDVATLLPHQFTAEVLRD